MLQGYKAFGGYNADRDDGIAGGICAWRPRRNSCVSLRRAEDVNFTVVSVPGQLGHAHLGNLTGKDTLNGATAIS